MRRSCLTSKFVWAILEMSMYFSGKGNVLSSARRVELDVHCDDDRWSHLGTTKNRHGLQRHLWFLSEETLPVHHEVLCWNLRSLRMVPALEWILGIRGLFLIVLLYHLQMGIWIHHLLVWPILLSRWFFEDKYLMHPTFPKSSRSAVRRSPFQIPPATSSQPGKIPGNTGSSGR